MRGRKGIRRNGKNWGRKSLAWEKDCLFSNLLKKTFGGFEKVHRKHQELCPFSGSQESGGGNTEKIFKVSLGRFSGSGQFSLEKGPWDLAPKKRRQNVWNLRTRLNVNPGGRKSKRKSLKNPRSVSNGGKTGARQCLKNQQTGTEN